jgi:hypothetical protein
MINRANQNWPDDISDGEIIGKVMSDPGLKLVAVTPRVVEYDGSTIGRLIAMVDIMMEAIEPEDEMLRRTR